MNKIQSSIREYNRCKKHDRKSNQIERFLMSWYPKPPFCKGILCCKIIKQLNIKIKYRMMLSDVIDLLE